MCLVYLVSCIRQVCHINICMSLIGLNPRVASLPVVSLSLRYLITAPLSLRLDAVETVLLQLFGFTEEVTVYVFLKTSMAPDHVVLAQEVVTLNATNHHQAAAKVQVRHDTRRETHDFIRTYVCDVASFPVSLSSCTHISWTRA